MIVLDRRDRKLQVGVGRGRWIGEYILKNVLICVCNGGMEMVKVENCAFFIFLSL